MTRRSSLRAQARRIYRETAAAQADANAATPTPDPSPHPPSPDGLRRTSGGGEAAPTPKPTRLTARVRKLYEASAVPVAEIAKLAGVTERTIYKYARKGRWQPRYAWTPDGARPPPRPARGRWSALRQVERAQAFAAVKGAGGRFVRREDEGKPYARGLKATDPQGERRAAAQCAEAATIAAQAQAEAEWQVWNAAFVEWLKTAVMLRDALAAYRKRRQAGRANAGAGAGEPDAYEQRLSRAGHIAVDYLQFCQAQTARCGLAMTQRA